MNFLIIDISLTTRLKISIFHALFDLIIMFCIVKAFGENIFKLMNLNKNFEMSKIYFYKTSFLL